MWKFWFSYFSEFSNYIQPKNTYPVMVLVLLQGSFLNLTMLNNEILGLLRTSSFSFRGVAKATWRQNPNSAIDHFMIETELSQEFVTTTMSQEPVSLNLVTSFEKYCYVKNGLKPFFAGLSLTCFFLSLISVRGKIN